MKKTGANSRVLAVGKLPRPQIYLTVTPSSFLMLTQGGNRQEAQLKIYIIRQCVSPHAVMVKFDAKLMVSLILLIFLPNFP